MMNLEESKARAAATYDAAADLFDHPANTFWDRFGGQTVKQIGLRPAAAVLDVCCGSGASALPAAEAVGDGGYVIGIDLAGKLLELGRNKARKRGLNNVRFQQGDMLNTGFEDERFDAVICVFGIFFVPDSSAAIRELWRVLRPGGTLAVTTWGPDFFEPANQVFWNAVREVRPDLYKGFNPWDRISEPSALAEVMKAGGVTEARIVAEPGTHPLASAADWWTTLLGSGYRGTIAQLQADEVEYVRQSNLRFIEDSGLTEVQANVVYAFAQKPQPEAD